ncbi:hypothetical protein Pla22_21170 [Rubripirellula amarantea]|uniref:Uncharacterized protein n=1 Tax=Rubripirellula amarantea TaxID=2527999 RepID=A0A5C5WV93_9BACT|nr:hypothetical protein Pla22_21170 [Rubripirellula amarantea]
MGRVTARLNDRKVKYRIVKKARHRRFGATDPIPSIGRTDAFALGRYGLRGRIFFRWDRSFGLQKL